MIKDSHYFHSRKRQKEGEEQKQEEVKNEKQITIHQYHHYLSNQSRNQEIVNQTLEKGNDRMIITMRPSYYKNSDTVSIKRVLRREAFVVDSPSIVLETKGIKRSSTLD